MIIKALGYSGAPRMFLWLAKSLADRGNEVSIFTYKKNEDVNIPDNIKLCAVNLESQSFIAQAMKYKEILKSEKPVVSVSFLLDANVINILACMGLQTKSVVCERNDPFKPRYYKLKLLKPLFRFADGSVFQLPKVAQYYDNIKGITAVIPNPVLCEHKIVPASWEQREKTIVSVGRLDLEQKRQDVLIEAFSLLAKRYPDYRLVLYGNGQDASVIESLPKKYGIEKNVIFPGVTDNPQEVASKCKLFVLSSDFEGIPNALIEAMSIGMPVISTDCRPGGAALLIEDRHNGMLVPPHDAHSLYKAMEYMIGHPSEADRMGNKAREITERFSETNIANMWQNYLNRFES